MNDFHTILAAKLAKGSKTSKKLVSKPKKKKVGSGGSIKKTKSPTTKTTKTIVKKDINKRNANIKTRMKNGGGKKPANPNKVEKVLERHKALQSKSPNKNIPIKAALVKQTRTETKKAVKSINSKARKANSKTRTKAASKTAKMRPSQLAKKLGMPVKEAEKQAQTLLNSAKNPVNFNYKLNSFLGKLGAFTINVLLVGGAVAGVTALAVALPTSIQLVLGAGLMQMIAGGLGISKASDEDEGNSYNFPALNNLIPVLADYIKSGNLEEIFGMIESMSDDPEYDDASNKKKFLTYSHKNILNRLETLSGVTPNSRIKRLAPIEYPEASIYSSGIYVCWSLKRSCAVKLEQWARDNSIPNVKPANYMHCTIIMSKTSPMILDAKKNYFEGAGLFKKPLSPQRLIRLRKLGPSAIVIEMEFYEAHNRFEMLKDLGCTSDFPSYVAHVTVGEDKEVLINNKNLKAISLPTFPLEFDYEYCGPLLDDKKQRHAVNASTDVLDALVYKSKKAALTDKVLRKKNTMLVNKTFASVLASSMEELACRKKKAVDPSPPKHRKNAIKEYRAIIEFFKEFDLTKKITEIEEMVDAAEKVSDKNEMKDLAKKLRAMVDTDSGIINNDFFSKCLKLDDGPKEIARSLSRLAKYKE